MMVYMHKIGSLKAKDPRIMRTTTDVGALSNLKENNIYTSMDCIYVTYL